MASDEVVWLAEMRKDDVGRVGGKNASLGEMISAIGTMGVTVPDGFATTAAAYWHFVEANQLRPVLAAELGRLAAARSTLEEAGSAVRAAFVKGEWPADTAAAIVAAYRELGRRAGTANPAVAVRSSATAEDLPDASFAGQQETFLNVRGESALLDACRRCLASLFTDRAIVYREEKGFDHLKVALSIGVQLMVRADLGASGTMFSIDTETGFDKVVLIDAAWGLGETVVQGSVDPDSYIVFKPLLDRAGARPVLDRRRGGKTIKMVYAAGGTETVATTAAEQAAFVLTEDETLTLGRWAVAIERHYGRPMDIEWARDGETGKLFILQARPETVQSRHRAGAFRSYTVLNAGETLVTGLAVGDSAATGEIALVASPSDTEGFPDGAVLVAESTDPDWLPLMRRASAIVTDHGGRTSHAAIVSRELGLPAIVGTGNATVTLRNRQKVTVSCASGDKGFVYAGTAEIVAEDIDVSTLPVTRTKLMLNLADPAAAFRWWRLPADGVGLARMEFVIAHAIRIHPMALLRPDKVTDPEARAAIGRLTAGYADGAEYFVEQLAFGLSRIAAALHPHPVLVRMSDFKTNEYANLIGGQAFEEVEENPMLGFRGASRYISDRYAPAFSLECRAIRRLREQIGLTNVAVMIPFCRSVGEADRVLAAMAANGLERGRDGLEVHVMCEIPANVIEADAFAKRFDGFSIGSNDLTQLTLGVDRDSVALATSFDERDPAVKWMIQTVIERAHRAGRHVGLCGQAPSDHPDYADFLVRSGIDSISVSPDSFVAVRRAIAAAEGAWVT
ncbi:MAG: phosphoenolpyruvate synthase [Bauldia sp.]|nr:phosphoenolpyruvate synthase [Bauldia sp.]